MTDTRDFDLADILSITTGRLLSHRRMAGVYDILNFLTGDNLMTHQLPRAAQTCRGPLTEQLPFLTALTIADEMEVDALFAWLAEAETRYGARHPVAPLATWEHRNPLVELAEMVGGKPIIPVVIAED